MILIDHLFLIDLFQQAGSAFKFARANLCFERVLSKFRKCNIAYVIYSQPTLLFLQGKAC